MLMLFCKAFCLFLFIAYGFICAGRLKEHQYIGPVPIYLMSTGLAGFVVLQYFI